MAIRSSSNLYTGVNAHLHSILQNRAAGWEEFHLNHIVDLARAISALLPPGYRASAQRSFQIRASTSDMREWLLRQAEPDVAVQRIRPHPSGASAAVAERPASGAIQVPVIDAFETPDEYLGAVAIRALDAQRGEQTVAWLELLSPTNKPPHPGYYEYNAKRVGAIQGGIVFVEIDYLHQSRPVIATLPVYPAQGAFAYYTTLTIPAAIYEDSSVNVQGFGVDDPIPTLEIPLLGDDTVRVDLGAVYNFTFGSVPNFSEEVDYERLPPRFESYSPTDQARIRAKMADAARISGG
ncbi:MAG: DUF4058 family protein [Anaerolineae bacterium]|nr:DUF4058 family protein [Anaerolineae bacterium]